MCDALTDPDAQLQRWRRALKRKGSGLCDSGRRFQRAGGNGIRRERLEIAQQCEEVVGLSSVVVASGSAGTHAGLAVGLEHLMPDVELIGVTVSRSVAEQKLK